MHVAKNTLHMDADCARSRLNLKERHENGVWLLVGGSYWLKARLFSGGHARGSGAFPLRTEHPTPLSTAVVFMSLRDNMHVAGPCFLPPCPVWSCWLLALFVFPLCGLVLLVLSFYLVACLVFHNCDLGSFPFCFLPHRCNTPLRDNTVHA
jgi:hypothetical protein